MSKNKEVDERSLAYYCDNACVAGLVGLDERFGKEHALPVGLSMQILNYAGKLVQILKASPGLNDFFSHRQTDILIFESTCLVHASLLNFLVNRDMWSDDSESNERLIEEIYASGLFACRSIETIAGYSGLFEKMRSRGYGTDFEENLGIYMSSCASAYARQEPLNEIKPQLGNMDHVATLIGCVQIFFGRHIDTFYEQSLSYIKRMKGINKAEVKSLF